MHSELSNLWLFAQAIGKLSLTTGFGVGLGAIVAIHIGRTYRVTNFCSGDFVGRCIGFISVGSQKFAQFVITDTLRPAPRVRDKCPFPECIREMDHGGLHEFPRIREGAYIDVVAAKGRFKEVA